MGIRVAAAAPSPRAPASAPSTSSRSPFRGGGCGMLARSWAPGGLLSRRRGEGRPARYALSASIDGVGGGDMEFLRRIEELAASAGVRTAGSGWPPSLEQSASIVGLPLSLRMLKRKKQQQRQQVTPQSRWDERLGLGSAGESVGRAFSSMVLIVRELQSFALQQMQEALLCDDLQGVLERAHGEMQDSFVWLFKHIFAGTPALMLSLMLLLANFSVHSMSNSVAAAAAAAATVVETQLTEPSNPRFDAASVKTFSSSRTATASVGGGSGGGGNVRPVAGASGDDRWDKSRYSLSRVAPQHLTPLTGTGAENGVPDAAAVDEQAIWDRMDAEASSMQADARADELTDPDMLGNLVAPVEAEIETEDVGEYARTEQRYELAVSEEPNNSLILANFAQFLYITRKDHKRAEHYFEDTDPLPYVTVPLGRWHAGPAPRVSDGDARQRIPVPTSSGRCGRSRRTQRRSAGTRRSCGRRGTTSRRRRKRTRRPSRPTPATRTTPLRTRISYGILAVRTRATPSTDARKRGRVLAPSAVDADTRPDAESTAPWPS